MKPSGPGLFFFGRVLITDSVSLFVIGQFRLSVSFGFNFGRLYVSRNLTILSYPVVSNIIIRIWSFLSLRHLL